VDIAGVEFKPLGLIIERKMILVGVLVEAIRVVSIEVDNAKQLALHGQLGIVVRAPKSAPTEIVIVIISIVAAGDILHVITDALLAGDLDLRIELLAEATHRVADSIEHAKEAAQMPSSRRFGDHDRKSARWVDLDSWLERHRCRIAQNGPG